MILSKDRIFKREEPDDDAIMFIIFCEGLRREADYFRYFSALDSRVKIEVIPPGSEGNNSPEGLLTSAQKMLHPAPNIQPKYFLSDHDEVWFIIDTDKWEEKITALYEKIDVGWSIGQSNPCFELWLYFHFTHEKPEFEGMSASKNWKAFLDGYCKGGFDSKKHPILLEDAIRNATFDYREDATQKPDFFSTSVWKLGTKIFQLLEKKLRSAKRKYTDL